MSSKRSRATYETDLQIQQSPFVLYGKPLPPRDPDTRDDGSFVPIWKQEVTDDRGRKRLHGAFTGGFSAGYFNTVGSKEGWTPSAFVSSRANRVKVDNNAVQQKPEHFMDDEDLAEAAEAQKLHTTNDFAGIGSTEEALKNIATVGLFRTQGETMGVKLMKKMGWREGQGVGPKIRRKPRLNDFESSGVDGEGGSTNLFAPENTRTISFVKKNDHIGLGYGGTTNVSTNKDDVNSVDSGDEGHSFGTAAILMPKKKKKPIRSGIGIGILNDTGSDDEDPYEIGPRISYNKIIGGDKKKKKPALNGAARPVFISKKASLAKTITSKRKCHDGRLPLDGFILSSDQGLSSSIISSDKKYLPPDIPEGWKSAKKPSLNSPSNYMSTAEAAKASKLDPKSRAALLGESSLPGKSVFDYLSSSARDRLVSASGKTNLPPALGEIPKGYTLTDEERRREIHEQIPRVEKDTAMAALGKGASGWMPYAEDESKRSRYREYLEHQAGIRNLLPQKVTGIAKDDWLKELQEFAQCAQIFKPMTGMMATRFTSSSAPTSSTSDEKNPDSTHSLVTKPVTKVEDPAEQAAKLGMFGPMTRSSHDFYPTRLLCKRFNVKPPAHVMLDPERTGDDAGDGASSATGFQTRDGQPVKNLDLISKSTIDDLLKEANLNRNTANNVIDDQRPDSHSQVVVDPERNEALEGKRAGEAVFKAIFGDSDDDD